MTLVLIQYVKFRDDELAIALDGARITSLMPSSVRLVGQYRGIWFHSQTGLLDSAEAAIETLIIHCMHTYETMVKNEDYLL